MRKIVCFALLCIALSFSVAAQEVSLAMRNWIDVAPVASTEGDRISPPKMLPPEIIESTGGMLFRWEQPTLPAHASVEYEFVLLNAEGEVVFKALTADQKFRYVQPFPALVLYETYRVMVNTRVTDGNASYVVSGADAAVSFTYYPECTPPKNLKAQQQTDHSLLVTWDGLPASPGQVSYQVRCRPMNKPLANWTTVQVISGADATFKLDELGIVYEVEVQKICRWKDGSQVPSEPVRLEANTVPVSMDGGNCGGNYTFPLCQGPFSNAGNWTTLMVGGFMINVLTLTPDVIINPQTEKRDTVWDGTGRLSLPFGSTFVKVQWDNVRITPSGMICGTVLGISDAPQYWPDLNPGAAVWGDEICKPAPSAPGFDANGIHSETGMPWDPNGFGPTGTYDKQPPYPGYEPGMPYDSLYDPNGFNAQGYYLDTGSKYGPNGCSQLGLDTLGQPCNPDTIPYFWLQDSILNETNPEALELLQDVQDSLDFWIRQRMLLWQSTFQDTVTQVTNECANIRGVMNGLIISLGYNNNRELLLGVDEEYFAPGMWKNFSAPPQRLNYNIPRSANQDSLESKHVALYYCDKKLDTYASFKVIVDSLLSTNAGVPDLAEVVEDLILNLSAEDAQNYQDNRAAFLAWLYENLRSYLSNTFCDGQCAAPTHKPLRWNNNNPSAFPEDAWSAKPSDRRSLQNSIANGFPTGNALALAGAPDWELLKNAGEVSPQDLQFEFLQGWKYVNGVHRAFYLEAIGEARRMAALSPVVTAHDPELMPIEVGNRASDGRKYSVWLDQLKFTPDSAVLDAYIVLELPNGGKKLAFSALRLGFSPLGLVNSPAKLQLDNDVVVRMNNAVQITLNEGPDTYVSFDCDGYAGIGLDIDVEVCRNIVKPIDPVTFEELPDPRRVAAHIQVFLPTFDELYADISIDPFVIKDLEDFKWIVNGIVIDFSDAKSPAYEPPPGYASPFASGTSFSPLWRGFYMRTLAVRMPNQFNNNGTPMQIGVEKVVLDHMGVSGTVYAMPLLNLDNGNAGGWAFSVDEFRLTVLANQPAAANFFGKIHVPIFSKGSSGFGGAGGGSSGGGSLQNNGEGKGGSQADAISGACNTGAPTADDCFAYTAFIEPGSGGPKYRMTVNTAGNNWCVDMWKAGQVTINSGSQIDMIIENGQFSVRAKLNGTVKITEPLSAGLAINIPNITFQNLIIQNKAPYFTSGTWGFPVPNSVGGNFGGFGINLSDIKMDQSGDDPGLSFNAGIKIASGGVDVAAEGGFIIRGQMITVNGRQRWVFKNFAVDEIKLDGSFSGVSRIHGILQFYDEDPTFGTGWRGGVGLTIKGMAEITAVAQFGRIITPNNYKYFFVDALACLDKGWGGALVLKGFGGGVYFHMNRPGSAFSLPACNGSTEIPSGLGVSLSGIQYTPDNSKGLGIKATIVLASAVKQNAFNGNATLELLFNTGGGLSDLWIYGNARFMSVPQMNASPEQNAQNGASVSADLDMHMNFNTSTFDGNFQVFLNVAGGVVRGGGPGNRLGQAIIHIDPTTWYVKIGTPSARCSLVIDIPVIGEIGNISSYLEFGKGLDPMPPLPNDIAQLTGMTDYAGLSNRGMAMGGNGFIFGADLNVGQQDMEFLIFYAGLRAHLGFDVAILDYGPNAICANTGQQVGINGWYASGQVYAGIWGEMGIKVKIFGKRKQFKIFEVAIAAALQASLPNPFWAKGAVGGHYSILGGLIKGECHFDVTIGERCQVVGADNPLDELTVVQRVVPEEGTTGFAVDGKPEVYFNFAIGEAFTLTDPNNISVTYKASVDKVELRYYGGQVSRTLEWAGDKRSLVISPDWFLPGEDTIEVVIKSHVDSSNIRIYDEERIAKFVTGPGLRHIPPSNVKGSYPYDGQFNFYRNEIPNKKGYILLNRGQLDVEPVNSEKLLIRFQSSGGAKTELPIAFAANSVDKLDFDIPSSFFTPGGIYRMQVVRTLPGASTNGSSNNQANKMPGGGPGAPSVPTEETVYTAFFRVSQYGTFTEKINAWIAGKQDLPYQYFVMRAKTNMEPFDSYEIGAYNKEGLIKLSGCHTANSYYDNTIKPLLYDSYPHKHNTVQVTHIYRTNDSREGFPPTKAVFMQQASTPPLVKEADWVSGSVAGGGNTDVTLSHEIFKYCNGDYITFLQQTMTYGAQLSNQAYWQGGPACSSQNGGLCNSTCNIIDGAFKTFYCYLASHSSLPEPPAGQYKVMIKYALPGLSVPSAFYEATVRR